MSRRRSNGGSLLLAMAFVLFGVLASLLLFLKNASYENDFSMKERRTKANRALANGVMTDFMRQFSQSTYETGNILARVGVTPANDPLVRLADTFYDNGFTQVIVTTHTETNSLHFVASGLQPPSGESSGSGIKRLSGVVRIENPSLRYSDVEDPRTNFLWTGGAVMIGSVHCPAGLNLGDGWSWTFLKDVVVYGNLACANNPATQFQRNLYLSGTMSGNCQISGQLIRQAPNVPILPIDLRFYEQHNTVMTSSGEWWIFDVASGVGQMKRYQDSGGAQGAWIATINIPSNGAIFFSSGSVVHLKGQVRGRVTVVAGSYAPPTRDAVFVEDDLVYSNGTNSADSNHSLSVMTDGNIIFRKPGGGNLVTNGLFYSSYGSAGQRNMFYTWDPKPNSHTNFGVVVCGHWLIPWANYAANYYEDPNFPRFPPPGVPAQAYLVSWQLES